MKPLRYAAVILAGGRSSRMGRFKPLLPLGDETVTGHLVTTFLDAGVKVFLVTGHRADELRAGLTSYEVTFVENPEYRHGMLSSVKAGLGTLSDVFAGAFIAPVDIPLVSPSTVLTLLAISKEHPDRIVIPTFYGKKGHPPLVPTALFEEIRYEPRESNLRNVLHRHTDMTMLIPVTDPNITFDIDRSGDYAELLARYHATISEREYHEASR